MIISLTKIDLIYYVTRQINNIFPDISLSTDHLKPYVEVALERTEYCFGHVKNKYYSRDGETIFNHLNTDQYAVFLYYLSNCIHRMEGDQSIATKLYALNKSLHGVDMFYEVELPEVFGLVHPIGTVLGRGTYSNYLMVYQRCTVGSNLDGIYPTLGEGIVMYGGSAFIGDCSVGDNTWLSLNTIVMDKNIPPGSVVFSQYGANKILTSKRDVAHDLFQSPARKNESTD